MISIEQTAKMCHEMNKLFCESIGDNSQSPWETAEQWQKNAAFQGVKFQLENPNANCSDNHRDWCLTKIKDGWKYGPIKDATKKEHPCLVDYNQLPIEQQIKDKLFVAIVESLRNFIKL